MPTLSLPTVICTKLFPNQFQDGAIAYSQQQSYQTKKVFGVDIASLELERNPRMTRTPRDVSEEDMVTEWMNDYSEHIDLTQIQSQLAYACYIEGDQSSQEIVSAYSDSGKLRTLAEVKTVYLESQGYDMSARAESETKPTKTTA